MTVTKDEGHEPEEMTTLDRYAALERRLPELKGVSSTALEEALYTYSETHEFRIDSGLAMLMWQIVEWSKEATPEQVAEIRL